MRDRCLVMHEAGNYVEIVFLFFLSLSLPDANENVCWRGGTRTWLVCTGTILSTSRRFDKENEKEKALKKC